MKKGDIYVSRGKRTVQIFVVDFVHQTVVNGVSNSIPNNHKRIRNLDKVLITGCWARQTFSIEGLLKWYKKEKYMRTSILDT